MEVLLNTLEGENLSAIAVRLVEGIADDYDHVIWRNLSLRGVPCLENLLGDLITCFRHSQETEFNSNHPSLIANLIEEFRASRCLVILDNFESLFQPNNLASHYQAGYENYGDLLETVCKKKIKNREIITKTSQCEIKPHFLSNEATKLSYGFNGRGVVNY